MPLYFFLHDADHFEHTLRPALAACWRRREFGACRPLWQALGTRYQAWRDRGFLGPDQPLLQQAAGVLTFDRHVWRALVGEVLLCAAEEVPDVPTAPETLCWLLGPRRRAGGFIRRQFSLIEQAHFGTSDLILGGGWYRPEHAGCNAPADVLRLRGYLATVDPARWTPDLLNDLPDMDEERDEELALARDCLAALRALYERAAASGWLVVCELL